MTMDDMHAAIEEAIYDGVCDGEGRLTPAYLIMHLAKNGLKIIEDHPPAREAEHLEFMADGTPWRIRPSKISPPPPAREGLREALDRPSDDLIASISCAIEKEIGTFFSDAYMGRVDRPTQEQCAEMLERCSRAALRAALASAQSGELAKVALDLWRQAKPRHDAQTIRASIAAKIEKGSDTLSTADDLPAGVWDLLDVAAEMALQQRDLPPTLTTAARDVLAERRRQVEVEGWTAEHDDRHSRGEIAMAAASYANHASLDHYHVSKRSPAIWPWSDSWWKPVSRRRDLVKAGALILAEIERLDRAAAPAPQGEKP